MGVQKRRAGARRRRTHDSGSAIAAPPSDRARAYTAARSTSAESASDGRSGGTEGRSGPGANPGIAAW